MKSYTDGFFSIDPQHGFLPQKEPLATLPIKYVRLQQLIEQMPVSEIKWRCRTTGHQRRI